MPTIDTRRTLVFLVKNNQILLAMKKRGFGSNRWNGVGGKLEPNETLEQALIRECQEEIEVTPVEYSKVAEFDFVSKAETDPWHMFVHVYVCKKWRGNPAETEEMAPQWFSIDSIPYNNMWEDDQHWLPLVLAGDKVKGTFEFDEHEHMLSHEIRTVKEL